MKAARRWTIFVLTGLATFALGVSVARLGTLDVCRRKQVQVMVPPQRSQWPVLLLFLNRDLSKLDRESATTLRHAIDSVTFGMDPDLSPSLKPRVFQVVSNSTGEKRLLLVEIYNLGFTPGSSHLRLMLFDFEGRLLYAKTSGFYKELFVKVRVRKRRGGLGDMLVTETINILGTHRTHHFYALAGNEITPIDRKGVSR